MKRLLTLIKNNWQYLAGVVVGGICALLGLFCWNKLNIIVWGVPLHSTEFLPNLEKWDLVYSMMALIGIITSFALTLWIILKVLKEYIGLL